LTHPLGTELLDCIISRRSRVAFGPWAERGLKIVLRCWFAPIPEAAFGSEWLGEGGHLPERPPRAVAGSLRGLDPWVRRDRGRKLGWITQGLDYSAGDPFRWNVVLEDVGWSP
jgi:hypothetical protein